MVVPCVTSSSHFYIYNSSDTPCYCTLNTFVVMNAAGSFLPPLSHYLAYLARRLILRIHFFDWSSSNKDFSSSLERLCDCNQTYRNHFFLFDVAFRRSRELPKTFVFGEQKSETRVQIISLAHVR